MEGRKTQETKGKNNSLDGLSSNSPSGAFIAVWAILAHYSARWMASPVCPSSPVSPPTRQTHHPPRSSHPRPTPQNSWSPSILSHNSPKTRHITIRSTSCPSSPHFRKRQSWVDTRWMGRVRQGWSRCLKREVGGIPLSPRGAFWYVWLVSFKSKGKRGRKRTTNVENRTLPSSTPQNRHDIPRYPLVYCPFYVSDRSKGGRVCAEGLKESGGWFTYWSRLGKSVSQVRMFKFFWGQ